MDEKEKVYLLLEEYRTVRAELHGARSLRYLLAVAGGLVLLVALALATGFGAVGTAIGLIVLLVVLMSFALSELHPRVEAARARLCEIETEIDRRAGERLFVWESDRALYRSRFGPTVSGNIRAGSWPVGTHVGAHLGRLNEFFRARVSPKPTPGPAQSGQSGAEPQPQRTPPSE